MDADETPTTKRIKSEQTSVEPDEAAAVSALAGESAVKAEQEVLVSASEAGLPLSDAVKLEPTLADSASPVTEVPPTKKKKTSTKASSSKPKKVPKKTSAPSTETIRKAKPSPSPTPPPPMLEEDEDQALYCTCQRRQDDVEGGMIMCDRCDGWYHYRCMRITELDAELVDQFICPPCHEVTGEETTYKVGCAREACRRAAGGPFSKFCSQRCGVLMVSERMGRLGVRSAGAVEGWRGDARVGNARRTEGLTQQGEGSKAEWETVVEKLDVGGSSSSIQRLGLAGAFDLLLKSAISPTSARATTSNGAVNGTSLEPAPSASPNTAHEAKLTSSATSLLAITEQLSLITHQIYSVDLQKSALDARLDRLDSRSDLLHLVSDRVPTLPAISTANGPAGDEEDEEMAEVKPKKKKGSKPKPTTDAGPRCGYDARLHWDNYTFDAWSRAPPGSLMLKHDLPLDGTLEDTVCGLAKRKCRRHLDWSNLCELALDAEKGGLSGESRALAGLKLRLVEQREALEREREVVRELAEMEERRERRRREERDRDVAMRMANEGTRRG
ncbi:Zinc finger, PHD-finger [Kalmanozyma brasiliensis GHG001]|uniref:PHD-type domain-containing protein n=1 Tax=Kalmanozyma brasiliensis (strain GHG001) TaxID=1365824 RepID=V5EHI9_KALBG|nr:Zinc finger, PHD-finger [Kalmanozyma brasiliensis GHG001]EST10056.1 Zinc finger, PHD-finger [Kalmanozyma brasiliensis GHG001]